MDKINRQEFAASLPWITKLTKPKTCDGIKWGTVALKDLYPSGPKDSVPARGIQDRSRCKNKGWWKFRALRPISTWYNSATSGTYCWSHLMQQINSNDRELNRIDNAWNDYKKENEL